MAPKRFAPPPPVDSSEETASGSGTDDSEEEIALSPPSVTPRYAPSPQKVQQPESSDEEEEDGDEEEEEEEEEAKLNPPAATQNPPPLPPKRADSESDEEEEEEEETDDEAPQPLHSPKQVTEVNGGITPPPSKEMPAEQIQRALSKDDEIRILEVLAAHRRENGKLPQAEELEAVLAGSLGDYDPKELVTKLKYMKASYTRAARNGVLIKDRDSSFLDLCNEVWGGGGTPANGTEPRDFNEISQMYPFLGEEIKMVEKTHPRLFKRQYNMITDEKARSLDQRIKKQRMSQIKLELRRSDVIKEVTKTLMGLIQ